MDNITVKCTQCGKAYSVPPDVLGRKGKCKACGTVFTATAEASPVAEIEEMAQAVAESSPAGSATLPPQKKGFLATMSEMAEKASRQVAVTYVQGPWGITANTAVTLVLEDDGLLLRTGLINKKEFAVPYEAITGVTVDTAERMTLTRVLLVGIFAFGMKKKDKFLKLDFTDDTGTSVSAIFGKSMGTDIQTLSGRILEKKRGRLLRIQDTPTAQAVEDIAIAAPPPPPAAATDVASSIEKLARLRDQGLLTDAEFQAKKMELLARL